MAFVKAFEHAFSIAPQNVACRTNKIRRGEDAGFSRRSLRLLCGDWLPHDDGASEGCLALATDVGVIACPTQNRGFPLPRPASSLLRIVRGVTAQALSGMRRPIDQTNPSSSRATAAVATTERFPRAVNRRYVLCRRNCAFQANALISWGTGGQRSFIHCPTFGVVR